MNFHEYKTLNGLLKKVEKVLKMQKENFSITINGMSGSMFLANSKYVAEIKFNALKDFNALIKLYSVTNPKDLQESTDGYYCGINNNISRNYIAGDNIPGVGIIQEIYNEQYRINDNWYHQRCFK